MSDTKELLTLAQVADLAGIGYQRAAVLMREDRGPIPALRKGRGGGGRGAYYFEREEVECWLTDRRNNTKPWLCAKKKGATAVETVAP